MISAPEPLRPEHDIRGFACGEPSLDHWLARRAAANQVSGASRTFVVCKGAVVVGYYALASGAVGVQSAPGPFRRNMPDPIPVVLLARLAVATSHHGRGLGRALFRDAAVRVLSAADTIGIRGLLVHAISDTAAAFYLGLGLERSALDPMILLVTMNDLRASYGPLSRVEDS